MRRLIFILVNFLFIPFLAGAQSDDQMEKIIAFVGAVSEEDIPSEEYELLQDALRNPLRINLASKSRLVASGLLTPYQAASLIDYRKRFGYVLSFAELSAVDGFGQSYVNVLKPFISLDAGGQDVLSSSGTKKVYNELSLRGGGRYSIGDLDYQYGLKYGLDVGDVLRASLGASKSISARSAAPSDYSASLCYDFRKIDAKLILGDFNARFGQGLLAWNGAMINTLNTPSAFMKKASGVTPVRSFTGSAATTGAALEFGLGRFYLTSSYAVSGAKIVNFRRLGRLGAVGVTTVYDELWKTSLDASVCIKGVNIFGEVLYGWSGKGALVAGTDWAAGENFRFASLLGWSQGEQCRFAFAADLTRGSAKSHSITISSDMINYLKPKDAAAKLSFQARTQLNWQWKVSDDLVLKLRLSDRFRTWGLNHRAELRIDVTMSIKDWSVDSRLHILKSRKHSGSGYVTASYRLTNLTLHSRVGAFVVDNWDDRIYAYEYDAPGSFNVPAYYGRGVWTSSMLSWKLSRWIRIYARASYICYAFMPQEKKKPGRAELKLQTVFKF